MKLHHSLMLAVVLGGGLVTTQAADQTRPAGFPVEELRGLYEEAARAS